MPYNYKKLLKNDTFCGHLNYSPPEALVDGCEEITDKADVWALGCCLYFLTYKKDPFESNNSDIIKSNIRSLAMDELKIEKKSNDKILDDLIKVCLQSNLS
jgi:serine/threonine-protein kinase TTK/MPS1